MLISNLYGIAFDAVSVFALDLFFLKLVCVKIENLLIIYFRDYLQLNKKYGGISLEEYALSDKTGQYQDRIGDGGFGRNQMLWDFGLDEIHFENSTVIRSKIEEIESTFELVLLTEQFDESMVLLKDLLCWDYRDMTSLKLNAQKASSKSKISKEARDNLKKWMWGDYMVSIYCLNSSGM